MNQAVTASFMFIDLQITAAVEVKLELWFQMIHPIL